MTILRGSVVLSKWNGGREESLAARSPQNVSSLTPAGRQLFSDTLLISEVGRAGARNTYASFVNVASEVNEGIKLELNGFDILISIRPQHIRDPFRRSS